MDAEQIRREMSATRASIDRKLDVLAERTTEAKQIAVQRSVAALALGAVTLIVVRWWGRRNHSDSRWARKGRRARNA